MKSTSSPVFTALEKVTLVHVLLLVLSASWIFGGNIWWMRPILSGWASLGIFITVAACLQTGSRGKETRRRLWWLLPWALFILLVLISAANPSFRPMNAWGSALLVNVGASHSRLPSCVDPAKTLYELWFCASVYLSAFNLLLVPRSRNFLRVLFIAGATSCLLLAIFGTLQKLVAHDLYFGAAHSPNTRFFATFIYNNHWGAFMILWLSVSAGLIFRQASRVEGRDLWHSPFAVTVLALLLIAASAPVSASRAATAMALIVLAITTAHGLWRVTTARRSAHQAAWPSVAALLLLVCLAGASIFWIAQRSINERYLETRQALSGEKSLLGGRMDLYRDTWKLAMRQPIFGWGLESYGTAFYLIRPRPLQPNRQYENSYTEAHSDWLQSVAETGFVGTLLVVLMGAVPFFASLGGLPRNPVSIYALLGCGLVLAYAWIEFPFANGAFLISFWVIFFAACRHIRLEGAPRIPSPSPHG